jgi:hypothetical protein
VVKDIGLKPAKPYGLGICDKMDFMAFQGQGFTKFCSHHATSSKGGIQYNSNFHRDALRFLGSFTQGKEKGYSV